AGGAYVPLDPTYPSDRLAFMLEDSKPLVLLTKQHLLENVPEHGAQVVCLDSDWETIAQHSGENFDSGVQIQDLAYVIYTSGSTGKPKGVLVTHTGVYNAIEGHLPDMQVGCDARVLQFASFSFDASVSEILSALLTGATLYLARRETLMTGQGLVKLLQEEQITHGTIPPSVLMLIADNEFPHLRTIISAGEAISREMILLWKNKGHRIVNGYGPTECTILITWELMEGERLPYLGKPVQNTYGYLVDKHMQPVPIGVPGELLIGGLGVARGYLNRPDLTAEKFIPDPFSGVEGARVYRTGDLIRYWEDGTMEYLGRIDHQVKIRGFRIEIGEIEELLAQHEDVRQVVVAVREDAPGQKRLVAYIAPHNGKTIAGSDLRLYLKQKLPEYMVPSAYVFLDVFPLSPNGKVDRHALPAPDSSQRDIETEYVPPSNDTESKITEVWQEVLQLEKVGVHDNFFDLGGHSLLVTVAHTKIQERLQLEFSVVEMFSYPTISSLSKYLAQQQPETPTIEEFKDRASKQRDAINRRKQLAKDRRKHDE
ncbi:MAG: non-ribosomal peptide synthetase, partial [Tumebacillaceae bacterium]